MLITYMLRTIPALFFFILVVEMRFRATAALLVFFVGPLIGTFALAFALLLTNQILGPIGLPQLPNIALSGPLIFLFVFPRALYPHGALLGALVLLSYACLERSYNLTMHLTSRRLATGVLIGGVVGGLFAILVVLTTLLTQQNPDFIRFISNGTVQRLDPSIELLLGICTGIVDGALIAMLGVKAFRQ
jgi:hypothetical protein